MYEEGNRKGKSNLFLLIEYLLFHSLCWLICITFNPYKNSVIGSILFQMRKLALGKVK